MKTRTQVLENLFIGKMLHNAQLNKYYRWHNETLEVSMDSPNGPWKMSHLNVNMNPENFEVFTPPPKVTAFAFHANSAIKGDILFVIEGSERYHQLKAASDRHIEVSITPDMVFEGLK